MPLTYISVRYQRVLKSKYSYSYRFEIEGIGASPHIKKHSHSELHVENITKRFNKVKVQDSQRFAT